MGKRGSIVHQCKTALQATERYGHSKRQEIARYGKSNVKGTFNWDTLKQYLSSSINFARWCKQEYEIRDIREIDRTMYEEYIEFKRGEVSEGWIGGIQNGLRKLEEGIIKEAKNEGIELDVDFFSTGGRVSNETNPPKDRSYTVEEREQILSEMDGHEKDATELSFELGTRLRETVELRVENIVITRRHMYLEFKDGESQGQTKGARGRIKEIPKEYRPKVRELIAGKEKGDRIFDGISKRSLTDSFRTACEDAGIESHGFHGTRHTFAREAIETYAEKVAEKYEIDREDIIEAKDRIIENIRKGEEKDYGFGENERELYEASIESMDKVMDDLGHGPGRTQLYVVYLGR
ncbi:tyrosine-type recombinase/integrase [Robertmurraya sp.]|uniref:tyrosine-type recombinase/integrase n=1 Tax=Robertmurraya sp. TaxID=2837525 RepID=UPI0037048721